MTSENPIYDFCMSVFGSTLKVYNIIIRPKKVLQLFLSTATHFVYFVICHCPLYFSRPLVKTDGPALI